MKWSEDWIAVFTGALVLLFALIVFVAVPSGDLMSNTDEGIYFHQNELTSHLDLMTTKLQKWSYNPLSAFAGKNYSIGLLTLFLTLLLLFGSGAKLLKTDFFAFAKSFAGVFLIGILAYLLASQIDFKSLGLGYALWAISIGIFISNAFGIPEWLKPALKHEFYIKTGLVLLGAEVLFGKILAIGLPGIFVAWVVTPIVLVSTYWFGQRILKVGSKSLNMTISADMSVCGVSAAIATAAACNAKKEELTTAIGLSMVFTSVMMIALPAFIKAVGMPEVLGGAWLGGTIDATGAVVAAGAFLGDTALNVAATIKMIQNILIGVIAFAVAVYWTTKVDKTSDKKISGGEIWKRFPKFILGFIGASILFSILQQSLSTEVSALLIEKELFGFTKAIRGWLFCLAFVSIGLSINFKELKAQFHGGKSLLLYLCGQLLNLGLTLLMAWLMFYKVFPEITNSL
ncbi:MAG: putative sulfate exporter family transporter [Cyclobacteriaceae bacterium]